MLHFSQRVGTLLWDRASYRAADKNMARLWKGMYQIINEVIEFILIGLYLTSEGEPNLNESAARKILTGLSYCGMVGTSDSHLSAHAL